MSENPLKPTFPLPDQDKSNITPKLAGGFNIDNIPRFKNPNIQPPNSIDPDRKHSMVIPPTIHEEEQAKNIPLDVKGAAKKNLPPQNLHNSANNQAQREAAQKKLAKMRSHRHWSTVRFAVMSFVVFLIIFNFQVIYSQALYLFASKSTQPTQQAQPVAVTPTATQPQAAEVVDAQNKIIIPKIGVNAPLVFPETIEEQAVLRALQDGVVHYSGTASPGQNGNSVLFGHSSNDVWEKGNFKFVFVLLEKLVVGDQYEIHFQSRKYVYMVEETKTVEPNDLTVLNQTSTPYSTLITCTPPGTSWKRFIVKAKQIAPTVQAPEVQTASTPTQPPTTATVLPSAAPTLLEQVQIALSNLFNTILGRTENMQNTQPTQQNQPANHLPEVTNTIQMPTTF